MAADTDLKYQFTADTQQFVSSLNDMMSKMQNAANDATGAGKSIESAFASTHTPVDNLGKSVQSLSERMTSSLGGAARSAGTVVSNAMQQAMHPIELLQMAVRALTTEFGQASNAGKSFVSSLGQAKTGGLAVGLVAAGVAATAMTLKFAGAEREVSDLAKTTNLGEGALRRLAVAGSATGTDLKDMAGFATAAHTSIRNIKEKTDEGAVALQMLGINLKSIKNDTPEEQFRKIADAILAMNDSATAGEIAQTLLGTSIETLRDALGDSATKALALSDAQNELLKAQEANANGYTVLNQSIDDFKTAMADAKAGAGALAEYLIGYLTQAFDYVIRKAQAVASAVANMFSSVAGAIRSGIGMGDASSVPAAGIGPVLPTGGDSRSVPKSGGGIGPIQPGSDSESGAAAARLNQTYQERLATLKATDVQKDVTARKDMKNADAEAARYGKLKKAADDAKGGGGGGGKAGKSDEEKKNEELEREAQRLKDLFDPMQKLNRETEKFNELFSKGLISADVRDKAIAKATEDAEKRMKELNKSTDMMGKTFDDIKEKAKSWSDTLIDGIVDGKKSFGDMIASMLKDIAKISVKNALAPMFEGLGGKGKTGGSGKAAGGGGGISSLLGGIGKKAAGGAADGLTLVGERGPELAMFGSGGGYVANAADTQRMLNSGSNMTSVSNITVNVPQGTTPDQGAKIAKYMDQALEARIRKSQVDQRRAKPLRG